MRYFGGKNRIAKRLASEILPRVQGRLFEPFHGGMSASVALQPAYASDSFEPLTRLVAALRAGWIPPDFVSEDTYYAVRGTGTPLEAFAGFCCSFSGKWFGGYARDGTGRNYAMNGKRSLAKKMAALRNTYFDRRDYFWVPVESGDTLYCDPPYVGTTSYKDTLPFNHALFWDWCTWQASRGILVFVSEFTGPPQYLLCEFESKSDMHTTKREQRTVEKLFMIAPK